MDVFIIALWVALSVFVLWYALAQEFLKRRAAQKPEDVDPAAEALLQAQSEGLDSVWDTIKQA